MKKITPTQQAVIKLLKAGGRVYRKVGQGLDLEIPRGYTFGHRVTQLTADSMERKGILLEVQTTPTRWNANKTGVEEWGVYDYILTEEWSIPTGKVEGTVMI
jgi:hypothetical protein